MTTETRNAENAGASRRMRETRAAIERGDWTNDPAAKRLLASCAANPPKLTKTWIPPHERWTTEQYAYAYVGTRVDQLAAIRSRVAKLVMAACDEGDRRPLIGFDTTRSVHDAIGEAIAAYRAPVAMGLAA